MKELGLLVLLLVLCLFITSILSKNRDYNLVINLKNAPDVTNNHITGADTIIVTVP